MARWCTSIFFLLIFIKKKQCFWVNLWAVSFTFTFCGRFTYRSWRLVLASEVDRWIVLSTPKVNLSQFVILASTTTSRKNKAEAHPKTWWQRWIKSLSVSTTCPVQLVFGCFRLVLVFSSSRPLFRHEAAVARVVSLLMIISLPFCFSPSIDFGIENIG